MPIASQKEINLTYNRNGFEKEELLSIYKALLSPRLIEEKMLILLRQGKLAKWFSGIGQEAISVGCGLAMADDEYILTMHRNLGVFTTRKIPWHRLFSQWMGKEGGFTQGRDRSFHFGTQEYHIVGMISHLAAQMGVADGIALADLLRKNNKVTAVFTGDGATSEGDFHEALNVAAVWNLPVILIIENNGYGLSTPSQEQFRMKQFIDKGIGYGMEARQVDGNNILDTYKVIREISESIRKDPHPVLLECLTFRMRGHEEASGTKYVPKELFEKWEKKDPVLNYENYLLAEGILKEADVTRIHDEIKTEIERNLEITFSDKSPAVDSARELGDVYSPTQYHDQLQTSNLKPQTVNLRFLDAIRNAMLLALRKYPELVIMGQDIAEYGGVFKATEGFLDEFGRERIRNTPLCESAIIGAAFGLSINGMKAIVEMQFADFVSCGFNQIVNNLAKSHYRWGQYADVVIRMPTGAGVNAGPFHSQSNEAWFVHTPGLKVVYPAFPSDAKGLLLAAIEDPNPVMYFEHKALYRSITEEVPENYFILPIGKAALLKEGNEVSIITYGYGVHWALEAMEKHPEISADLIDLRTLLPWDKETVETSIKKTGKVIILHEDTLTGGIGGEMSAHIAEHCFQYLDAPIVRVASLDTPVPMNSDLEWNFLPKERFEKALLDLLLY